MSFDRFRQRIREAKVGCYTFMIMHDQKIIERKFRWPDSPDSTARVLDELVGFETLSDATKFDYGIAHPVPIATAELGELARKNVGPSMVEAFSPFDRALRHAYPGLRYERVFREHQRNCNIITFGSPSSNAIARAALGYSAAPGSQFRLDSCFEPVRYPVQYDLTDELASVKRRSGQYAEPKWSISTPAGRLETATDGEGYLTEDYLIISCVPNLLSDPVHDVLDARAELDAARLDPNLPVEIARSRETRKRLRELEQRAGVDDAKLHRVVVIGGLHGPGTAAARLLLSDSRLAKHLEQRVRQERLDGRFWQAVIKVTEVGLDAASGRDVPRKISDRIDLFPVNIA